MSPSYIPLVANNRVGQEVRYPTPVDLLNWIHTQPRKGGSKMTRNEVAEPTVVSVISGVPAGPADPDATGADRENRENTAPDLTPAAGVNPATGATGVTGVTRATGVDPDSDVVDPLMWRDAQHLLSRHAEPGPDGKCTWCGWRWPCPPRRLAERAEVVARRPRPPALAPDGPPAGVRHDVPAWRSEVDLQADNALPDCPVSPAVTIQPRIRGVVRLPRQHRNDPPAPA